MYIHVQPRGGTTASRDARATLPLQIQTAIVKSLICWSTVEAGYHVDILRNESVSTNKSSEHDSLWLAPHLVSVLVLCLLLYLSLNFALESTPETGVYASLLEIYSTRMTT